MTCDFEDPNRKDTRKKILVLIHGDVSTSPRPARLINLLSKEKIPVDVISFKMAKDCPVNNTYLLKRGSTVLAKLSRVFFHILSFFTLPFLRFPNLLLFLGSFKYGYRHLLNKKLNSYDWIIVESLQLLPLAFHIKNDAKILCDAREYYPLQHEHSIFFRLTIGFENKLLCQKYLTKCDRVITVSDGLSTKYKEQYGVNTDVILSVPFYTKIDPRVTSRDLIKMVHHGRANENRGLENLIDIFRLLDDRFRLDLYLTGDSQNINKLKLYGNNIKNLCFKEPIPFDGIVKHLSSYDVGLYYLEPKGFNVTHNLPNKFFEFIQARLMIAIGPSPEMASIVQQHNCGVVCEKFSIGSMVESLNRLDKGVIDRYKFNSDCAAKELCFELEAVKYLKIINQTF